MIARLSICVFELLFEPVRLAELLLGLLAATLPALAAAGTALF